MENKLIKQFNLPSYIKGKSFADASKAIENKFKDKTDKYSMETKEILMKRLADAQEYSKQIEAPQEQPIEQPMQNQQAMGGFDPTSMIIQKGIEGVNMGIDGGIDAFGKTGIDTSGASGFQNKEKVDWAGGMKDWVSNPMGAFKLAGDIIGTGKANKDIKEANQNAAIKTSNMFDNSYALGGFTDPTEPTEPKQKDKNLSQSSNASSLVFTDEVEGLNDFRNNNYQKPLNMGKFSDKDFYNTSRNGNKYILNKSEKNPYNYEAYKNHLKYFKTLNPEAEFEESFNSYKKGGYTNDYYNGGKEETLLDKYGLQAEGYQFMMPGLEGSTMEAGKSLSSIPTNDANNKLGKANLSGLKRAGIEAARLSPVAMNAYQLAKLEKPEFEGLNRLDNRYKKDLRDEASTTNLINSNFNSDFAKEGSAGNLGAYLANRKAAELSKLKAIDQGARSDDQINRLENTREQQFNLGVDRQNLNQSNQENELNARNQGNYDTQNSKLLSQLGTDFGNIGKEQTYKQMVKDSGICYDTSGAYICGSSERLTDEQVNEFKTTTNNNAKGGMLNSNSMFTSYLDYLKNK